MQILLNSLITILCYAVIPDRTQQQEESKRAYNDAQYDMCRPTQPKLIVFQLHLFC